MDEKIFDKIEKYIGGNLDQAELDAFENQMKADKSLAAEVNLHRGIQNAMTEKKVIDFEKNIGAAFKEAKEEMATAPNNSTKESGGSIFSMKRLLSIAATFLLIAAVGLAIYNLNDSSVINYAGVFEKNISYPTFMSGDILNTAATRGEENIDLENQIKQTWNSAQTTFENGNYEQTLQSLNAIQNLDNNFQTIAVFKYNYYRGITHLRLGQAQEAYDAFAEVNMNDANFGFESYFNKALAALLIPEKRTEAIEIFETLAESNHPKSKAAAAILLQLEK